MTDEKKQEVAEGFKDGLKAGYEATKAKTLTWWERALWVVLTGIAAAASAFLTGCNVSLTKLPDGSLSFSGSVVQPQPAAVEESDK